MRGVTRVSVFVVLFSFFLSAQAPLVRADKLGPARKPSAKRAAKALSAREACASLLTEAVPVKWVEKMIAEGKAADPQTQRLRDIVQRLGFNNAALNQAVLRGHNEHYTVTLDQGTPTDQKASGRCWIFAGLNMLRSGLIAEGKVPQNFEFSENYLHFFNMLEKSNSYLEGVIKQTYRAGRKTKLSRRELMSAFEPAIGDGGWYEYFMLLVSKYGLVPKEVMPETRSSENTGPLLEELRRSLAQTARDLLHESQAIAEEVKAKKSKLSLDEYLERIRAVKERGMQAIWKILATHLGDPPADFDFRTDGATKREGLAHLTATEVSRFTPRQFAAKFVGFDAADYVVVASSPIHEAGVYEQPGSAIGPAEEGEPKFDVRFMNVTPERLEELAAASIRGGQPVWFAADVGKDVDHASGIMHPDVYVRDPIYNLPKDEQSEQLGRVASSFFGISGPNHAMLLTGYDQPDPNGPIVKFRNENSWGERVGSRGTYHLYAEWFRTNVFQIVVHKKFLSPEELKAWEGKATILRENDPLF